MAEYSINKGIGNTVEFKGLKGQYLIFFAAGFVILLLLFAVMFMAGVNEWVCVVIGISSLLAFSWQVFRLNNKYGEYGLMKIYARKNHPRYIANRMSIKKLFIIKQKP